MSILSRQVPKLNPVISLHRSSKTTKLELSRNGKKFVIKLTQDFLPRDKSTGHKRTGSYHGYIEEIHPMVVTDNPIHTSQNEIITTFKSIPVPELTTHDIVSKFTSIMEGK